MSELDHLRTELALVRDANDRLRRQIEARKRAQERVVLDCALADNGMLDLGYDGALNENQRLRSELATARREVGEMRARIEIHQRAARAAEEAKERARADFDTSALEAELASCISCRDWQGASDAANHLRVLEALRRGWA